MSYRNRRERLRRLGSESEWGWGVTGVALAACAAITAVLLGAPEQLIYFAMTGLVGALTYSVSQGAVKGWGNNRSVESVAPNPPAARVTPAALRPGFRAVRARLEQVKAAYAAYESDPMRVLRLPALADVRVAATARFVDDLAAALVLDIDDPPDRAAVEQFDAAVGQAERSWRAARETAIRIRDSSIPRAERAAVSRVLKLLNTARHTSIEAERLAAYARARSELARLDNAGVFRLPRAAQLALTERTRGQLTTGTDGPA